MVKQALPGIWWTHLQKKRVFLTKNAVPGVAVYGEMLIKEGKDEYRVWDPYQSKLAAALHKGVKDFYLNEDDYVLYLGSSTGTTVSHLSDFVGLIFGVDNSPRVMRDFLVMSEPRKNIAPVLADASNVKELAKRVCEVDWLFQDVAQRNQVEIFLKNVDMFLKKGGHAVLALKTRSIDIRKKPKEIFDAVQDQLSKSVEIVESLVLDPYQKDHCLFVVRKV